jgi:hypothetical protein
LNVTEGESSKELEDEDNVYYKGRTHSTEAKKSTEASKP